jgi:hypothetical protein
MKSIAITVVLSIAALIALRHAMPGGFLLYQGIFIGFILAVIQCGVLWRKEGACRAFKDAALSFFVVYAFVFTVPTTVDRAYSVRMINKMAATNGSLSKAQISDAYQEYFAHGGGVDKRIAEQLATGSIIPQGDGYAISPRGAFLSRSFKLMELIFKCGDAA